MLVWFTHDNVFKLTYTIQKEAGFLYRKSEIFPMPFGHHFFRNF